MSNIVLFERLKRGRGIEKNLKPAKKLFFVLEFDEQDKAYISLRDEKQRDVETFDYRRYQGATRNVLKTLERIHEQNLFKVDWGESGERIFLNDHEFLVGPLLQTGAFVNADFCPLQALPELGEPWIRIEKDKDRLHCRLEIKHQGQPYSEPIFLTENYALCELKLIEIPPLGDYYSELSFFDTGLPKEDLEKYLSLLASHFDRVQVDYEGYRLEEGPARQAKPALIFEKIDEDETLYLRAMLVVPGIPPEFFGHYDLSRVATINDVEKRILFHEIVEEGRLNPEYHIQRLLTKHKKSLPETVGFYHDAQLFMIEKDLARVFIEKELSSLIGSFSLFGAEKLKSYRIRAGSPKLRVTLNHGIDFLEGDAELEFEGETISLLDALSQFRNKGYLTLSDGTQGIVNKAYFEKLERLFKKKKDGIRVSFFDLPMVEQLLQESPDDEPFRLAREVFRGFNELHKSKLRPPKVNAVLRPYQKKGFRWLDYLHHKGLGGCLADDMGLGKTLQAICLLCSIYPKQDKPSLVVMPRSLLLNWEREFTKFAPEMQVHVHYGPQRNWREATRAQVILTTYGLVRNDIETLMEEDFYYVILDESQNIKNINAQSSKAVLLLKAHCRLALSGTPVENHLSELYSLFRFLNPAMFGSAKDFNRNYAIPIQKESDKDAMAELRLKIYPFILRRLKGDVLKELPAKVEQTLYVDMSEQQRTLYEQRRAFYKDAVADQLKAMGIKKTQFFILQALNELRQLASVPENKTNQKMVSPKREILLDNLLDLTANGHKALVFANYLGALEHIGEDLENAGLPYLVMTGATRERQVLVERFQNDPEIKVFLMTLKTGGIGLNLTAADYVFIYDPWWNKAAENQAIDRAHRIGQSRTVFSYRLITRGTIEEKMAELQAVKAELFENLIAADGASIKSLNEEDIAFIFGN